MTLLYNIFLCWKKDFYMGVAECVRSWLPCSKTWMSGVFPARAGRESESSPSKVTVCREIKVMYQGPFWGTNPVLSVWQGLWPLYCQGRGGKALPHQTRFCRDHSFVGGRKIGQSVVGKDMRWTFWEIGKPYNAHHFLFLFFVPHWLDAIGCSVLPRPTITVPWRFAQVGDSSLWSSTTKRRAKRCWRGANWGWELLFWEVA